ncbi:MAG: hypothetical protein ACO1SX_06725 [Actinomycetota bacterium]
MHVHSPSALAGACRLCGSLAVTLAVLVLAVATAADPAFESARAKTVLQELTEGRLQAARAHAEEGVRREPDSPLLQRRLAQVRFCEFIHALDQVRGVTSELRILRRLPDAAPSLRDYVNRYGANWSPEKHEAFQKLLNVTEGPETAARILALERRLSAGGDSVDRPAQLLADAFQALSVARDRGDAGAEHEITSLWLDTGALFFLQELDALAPRVKPLAAVSPSSDVTAAAAARRLLGPAAELTSDMVLRRANALAGAHPDDPFRLAAAGDVLSLVGALTSRSRPLSGYVLSRLRGSRPAAAVGAGQAGGPSREVAERLYRKAIGEEELDPAREPDAAALRCYLRSEAHGGLKSLPALALRLYLLRVAFDPAAATALLDRAERGNARDASPSLEKARPATAQHADPIALVGALRQAIQFPRVNRSYFVGVPPPLAREVRASSTFAAVSGGDFAGYEGIFTALQAAHGPPPPRGAVDERIEIRLLRLRVANLLCSAVDWSDQAEGVHQKTLVLRELLEYGRQLSDEQRAALMREQEEHARLFVGRSAGPARLMLSGDGAVLVTYPNTGPQSAVTGEGPRAMLSSDGSLAIFGLYRRSMQ